MPQPHLRTVVVLAAGEGKRMKSALPKVLHPLLGRTLLGHVLAPPPRWARTAPSSWSGTAPTRSRAHLAEVAPDATPVLQAEQLGTGHAVRIALEAVPDGAGTVVVINGDVPLLRPETVGALVDRARGGRRGGHRAGRRGARPDRPRADRPGRRRRAWSRSSRSATPTPAQRAIREINAGIYAFDAVRLREALGKLSTDNDQGEEYLTDVFGLLRSRR